MRRHILSGVLSVVTGKFVVLLVGLVTTPILYRMLGVTRFGEYAAVFSLFTLYMVFLSAGVGQGVRKFLPEERDRDRWTEEVVGFYFRLALYLSVGGAVLMAVAARAGVVGWIFSPRFAPYFYVLAATVVAGQFQSYTRRTLMAFGLERYSEPLQVTTRVTFAVVALALLALGHGIMGVLVGHLVAQSLPALLGLAILHRQVDLRCVLSIPSDGFPRRDLASFNWFSTAFVVLGMAMLHVDVLLLQVLVGSQQVGYYKAALKLAEFLWFVPAAIQTVFVHSTAELWSRDRTDLISELTSRTTRYTLLLTALMAVGLAALADVVVPTYFGASARPAVGPLLVLLPGALGFAVARPIYAMAEGKGDLTYPILATGTAVGLNVVLNLLLIPQYGMYGAAVATSVSYGSMLVLHVWSARRVGFRPLADARLVRVTATTVLAAGPILGLTAAVAGRLPVFGVGIPLSLVVVPPAGFVTFGVLAVATRAITLPEVFTILAAVPGPVGRLARARS